MGVFTPVSVTDARRLLAEYEAGRLVSLETIAEGVQNTNYRLATDRGVFVLTLFEQVGESDAWFCLKLMAHLADLGVPTPPPVRTRMGELATRLNGRPAALVAWREGAWSPSPTPDEAAQAGAGLAQLHLAGADFRQIRANPLGPAGWTGWTGCCCPRRRRPPFPWVPRPAWTYADLPRASRVARMA